MADGMSLTTAWRWIERQGRICRELMELREELISERDTAIAERDEAVRLLGVVVAETRALQAQFEGVTDNAQDPDRLHEWGDLERYGWFGGTAAANAFLSRIDSEKTDD